MPVVQVVVIEFLDTIKAKTSPGLSSQQLCALGIRQAVGETLPALERRGMIVSIPLRNEGKQSRGSRNPPGSGPPSSQEIPQGRRFRQKQGLMPVLLVVHAERKSMARNLGGKNKIRINARTCFQHEFGEHAAQSRMAQDGKPGHSKSVSRDALLVLGPRHAVLLSSLAHAPQLVAAAALSTRGWTPNHPCFLHAASGGLASPARQRRRVGSDAPRRRGVPAAGGTSISRRGTGYGNTGVRRASDGEA